MSTNLFDSYQTDGSAHTISITITIGYAQIGSTSIAINNTQLITAAADEDDNYPNSFTIDLGTDASLKGKTVEITSTVTRVQPVADSSLIITVTNNGIVHAFDTLSGIIGEQGTLDYYAEISFT